jgi:hypothetical protein
MLNHRNLLSHTYDFAVFEEAIRATADRYLPTLQSLHQFLSNELQKRLRSPIEKPYSSVPCSASTPRFLKWNFLVHAPRVVIRLHQISTSPSGGGDALQAESIAAELDELPLPYRFDVKAYESIKQDSLREHIQSKGINWKSQ